MTAVSSANFLGTLVSPTVWFYLLLLDRVAVLFGVSYFLLIRNQYLAFDRWRTK